ncbi:hypothetical protein [Helicobacter mesocricetorum]|uniref:hypothetical protein n=1 Tax=Helicobacter mesocricetorum TaxID=87012 RepID=UPI000CF0CF8A|nr:hypothetical protein [Helicobacter mesocricetorum]
MKKVSLMAFSSICFLLLNACSQKPNLILNVDVNQSCKEPIVSYQFDYIAKGEFNHLDIQENTIKNLLKTAFGESGCFKEESILDDNVYSLEVLFGSINNQTMQGNFLSLSSHNEAIIEIKLAFHKPNETRIFNGKSTLGNQNTKYLSIGKFTTLTSPQIEHTLINAINASVNEAIKSFRGN